MSMQRIRDQYRVPAKRGGRVRYTGGTGAARLGTITSAMRGPAWLRIRLDGDTAAGAYHPTWELEYLDA